MPPAIDAKLAQLNTTANVEGVRSQRSMTAGATYEIESRSKPSAIIVAMAQATTHTPARQKRCRSMTSSMFTVAGAVTDAIARLLAVDRYHFRSSGTTKSL